VSRLLFELAWVLYQGKPVHPGLVTRTVNWVWPEIEHALRETVVEARMREIFGAEAALDDLERRGPRSPLVRVVVERLAQSIANEIAERQAPFDR
jgi:hypothetical protein